MRQALHIFTKDVRYLRWDLGALLLLMGLFVFTQTRGNGNLGYLNSTLLLSCLWAFVCARLVQAETIPGDRQFWITRPYEWRSLLGAKLLFVVVFIGASLLIAKATILSVQGFSVAAHIPGLLWSMMLISAGMLLPFSAFATLTRGLAYWMLSAIFVVGVIMGFESIGKKESWGGMGWMPDLAQSAILFAAALIVLLVQYKRRRVPLPIIVVAVALVGGWLSVPYLPFAVGLDLETRFSKAKVDPSSIQLAIRPPAAQVIPDAVRRQGAVLLAIPIEVSGLGEGQDVISDEVQIVIENESGVKWHQERREYLQQVPDGYRLTPLVDGAVFERVKGHAVHLHLSFYLTLLGNPVSTVIKPGSGSEKVSGVGRCRYFLDDAFNAIICQSPLRPSPDLLQVRFGEERWGQFISSEVSYSPFPADSSISALRGYYHTGSQTFAAATLTTLEPLAHFRRDIDLPSVYLADYQMVSRY